MNKEFLKFLAVVLFLVCATIACNKENKENNGNKVKVTGVTIEPATLTLAIDGTEKLTATVQPADASFKAVTWKSSNPEIATVSTRGLVKAKSAGTTTITVTTREGSFKADCLVTVPSPVSFTISNATAITWNSALFVVSVTCSTTVTDKGICYSSTKNPPTISDSKISKGGGVGNFDAKLTNLSVNTQYYARPYAIVNSNTYYGELKEFKTEDGIVIKGVCWAKRNLAAHGVFADNPEDYGALFQWGRKGDGHEQRTSKNYPTNNNNPEAGVVSSTGLDANGQIVSTHAAYGKFIKQNAEPYDWRSPKKDALWNSGTEANPVKTANDPCPAGWRVPTITELETLVESGSAWNTLNGVKGYFFGTGTNKLFLPAAGSRHLEEGGLINEGKLARYWSSTVGVSYASILIFYNVDGMIGLELSEGCRASGFPVRCVAE